MDTLGTVLLIFVALSALRGAWRGLSGEMAPLVGLVAGGGILWFGYAPARAALTRLVPGVEAGAAAFYAALAIAVGAMIVFLIVAKLAKHVGALIIPQPFDAIIGAVVGAAKVILLASVVAGLWGMAADRAHGLALGAERHPVATAARAFWANRFTLHSEDAQEPGVTPSHARH